MEFIVEEDGRGRRARHGKTKLKLKGKQLREMQEHIAIVNYALEKALHDCFLREEVFELLQSACDSGLEIERALGV
jgi:hypothetical protein